MDFDLTARRNVWIPVTWASMKSEGDAPAVRVEYTVRLLVDLVDIPEFERLFSSPVDIDGNPRPDAFPPATPERIKEWSEMRDVDRALALVSDWRDVKSNGQSVPFTEEGLRKLMATPNFGVALFGVAYPKAYGALKDTRSGNSDGSPQSGAASDAAE